MEKQTITPKRLERRQAKLTGKERVRLWDSGVIGYGASIAPKSISFLVQHRVNGKQVMITFAKLGAPCPKDSGGGLWTEAKARKAAKAMLAEMSAGRDPRGGGEGKEGVTLRDAIAIHVANMRSGRNRRRKVCSQRSIDTLKGGLELHFEDWLDRDLTELTALEIRKVIDTIEAETPRRGKSNPDNPPGRALGNRLIANLRAVWGSADELHDFDIKCPALRVRQGALDSSKERIPDGQFTDWYKAVQKLPPTHRDIHLLFLFSGIRLDGARHLRWDDVDFDRRLIHVNKAKAGAYTVPATATLIEILERRRRENAIEFDPHGGDAGWCFPTISRARPYRVIPLVEPGHSGIVGPQGCRRTYNSVAVEIGILAAHRDVLMSHNGGGVNLRHYTELENLDSIRKSAELVERALRERLGIKKRRGGKK
jgi:integrase